MTQDLLAARLVDPERITALRRTGLLDSGAEESFDRLADLARRVIAVPVALVTLVDTDRQYFKSCLGLPEPYGSTRTTPLSHSICQHALVSDGPLSVRDARSDRRLVGNRAASELGAIAYLGIPLTNDDGHILGSFCVIDREPRNWTDDEVQTMSDLAAAVTSEIALRGALAGLEREADREASRRTRAEDLFTLAGALAASSGVPEIAGSVAELAAKTVGAAFANIAILDPEHRELELRHGATLDPEIGDRWPRVPLDGTTPLGAALIDNQPILLATPEQIRDRFPGGAADAEAAGFVALAAHPVRDGSAAVGFAWTRPVTFTGVREQLIQTVSDLVGQALERARLYERERQVARDLQRSLLPRHTRSVPNADVAARYEAGAEALEVGGDWFDIGDLSEGHVVLAVGDIVGHGLDAAAAMGQLRAAFSALTTNARDVGLLVRRLDLYAAEVEQLRLSTAVVADFSPEDGGLRVITAGHVPAMIRRRDGTVEDVPAGGPPLGFDPTIDRPCFETILNDGDALVLYTDGLVERRTEDIDEGLGRMRGTLSHVTMFTAASLCDRVFEQLGAADDDAALLVLVAGA